MDRSSLLTWRYTFIPIYALNFGLMIFIPLYILSIGGNVVDVGIAFSVYYAVSIPASLFFGSLTDRVNRTKPFIIISVITTFPIVLAFILPGTVAYAWLLYALYAIAATAANPALNVLVMGRQAKRKKMPKYYSKFGIFSIVGFVLASAMGLMVPRDSLLIYLGFLLAFNAAAIALSAILIRDQPVISRERQVTRRTSSIMNLVVHKGLIEYGLVERLHSMLHNRRHRSLYQLLFAIVLFNIGYYVFYASYVPFQVTYGLSYGDVFVIQMLNGLAQIGAFLIILEMIKRPMLHQYFVTSTGIRGAAYIIMLLSVTMPIGALFTANMFAYMLGGAAMAFWTLSATVLLYHRIKGSHEGHYLGLWYGLIAASAIAGSLASGLISESLGYVATFSIAAILTAVSGVVFAIELKEH